MANSNVSPLNMLFKRVLILGFGAYMLYQWPPWLVWEGYHSKSWPHAEGAISSTNIVERNSYSRYGGRLSYIPVVVYHYQVGAASYTNGRMVFDNNIARGSRGAAQAMVDRYPTGKSVTVFYDPSNPADSVLEPGIQNEVLIKEAIAGVLIVFAWGLPRLRRKPDTIGA